MPRITKAKVKFISLCPRGANQLPVMFKADDQIELDMLVKAADDFDTKGELLAVVYAPELRDSQGDIADAETIRQMAHDFAKSGEGIDIRHDGKTVSKDAAYVAETFIVQKGDARFADFKTYDGRTVDVTGAWGVLLKVDDPELRKLYKDGKWNGVSMGGYCSKTLDKSDEGSLLVRLFKELLRVPGGRSNDDGDIDMKPEELKKQLDESNKGLTTAIVDGIKGVFVEAGIIKKADDKSKPADGDDKGKKLPEPPKFEGDPTKKEDLDKHARKVELWSLSKDVDWSNAESVRKYSESLAKLAEVKPEEQARLDKEAGVESGDSDEVKELKRKLHKAQRRSGQGNADNGSPSPSGLSKEDKEALAAGEEMAKYANERFGTAEPARK